MKFRAVSHRLIFWILGASSTLYLAISYYEYSMAESFIRQQVQTKIKLAKLEVANRIDSLLDNVSESVSTAAVVLPIEEADREHIQSLLKRVVIQHREIYGMAIALEPEWARSDESGFAPYYYHYNDTINYVDLSTGSYNYRAQEWYTGAVKKGEPVWSEPYTDDGGGNIDMVTYSVPIYTTPPQKPQLIGVVTADLPLDRIGKILSSLGMTEYGYAFVISPKGNIINHTNPDHVMSNITRIEVPPEGQKKRKEILESMMRGETGMTQIPCNVKIDNTHSHPDQCWISYQPITEAGWSIAIAVPMSEVNKSLLQYRNNSIAITATGLFLLTLIVITISRRITVPLLSLSESSQALARGELDTDINDYNLQDEVGTLARQFQRMQISLKDHIEKLEQQTAQRERLEGELGAAHDIQMQMLPDRGQSNITQANWQHQSLYSGRFLIAVDYGQHWP